jgi:hypothetical protein
MPATKDEIKVIAHEVAEHYFGLMKEYVDKEIQLHTAQCSARKFSKLMGMIWAVIGGVCVAMFNWILRSKGHQ